MSGRWTIKNLTAGCAGMVLGVLVVVGAEVYIVYRGVKFVSEKIDNTTKQRAANAPSQSEYDRLCKKSSKSDKKIQETCNQLRAAIDAAKEHQEPEGKHY